MKTKTLKKDCKWDFSKDQPTTTEIKRPPRKAKPVQTVPNLDILALGERISHLEQVVGKLFYVIKECIVQTSDQKHAKSVLSNFLADEDIKIDQKCKLI